jgi:hypothetical protein
VSGHPTKSSTLHESMEVALEKSSTCWKLNYLDAEVESPWCGIRKSLAWESKVLGTGVDSPDNGVKYSDA